MKKISVFLFLVVSIVASACAVVITDTKAPPGQVKKQTGSKSAKEYAPGQKKKG
ncbi:quinol oxidase subunit 4 [Chryseolinea sp. H1M3-3]|uniref:quinol oxidase subunit 4 n=1 Tax=Chryseolinea sp. H1M3-3 TaxID=3034144 RepID=UPI0023EBAC84|nr:quinol oxidase subunit 4 [Chryseolinea sp. H1M3-3]